MYMHVLKLWFEFTLAEKGITHSNSALRLGQQWTPQHRLQSNYRKSHTKETSTKKKNGKNEVKYFLKNSIRSHQKQKEVFKALQFHTQSPYRPHTFWKHLLNTQEKVSQNPIPCLRHWQFSNLKLHTPGEQYYGPFCQDPDWEKAACSAAVTHGAPGQRCAAEVPQLQGRLRFYHPWGLRYPGVQQEVIVWASFRNSFSCKEIIY